MTAFRKRNQFWAWSLLLLAMWPLSAQSSTEQTADQILGRWLFPARGSSIEVYKVGDLYFGRIAQVSPAGRENYGLSENQLLIRNLSFDGEGWSGGELIHPRTGSRFGVTLRMQDARTLTATVYKGFRWMNKEYVLTRQTTL